MRDQETLQKFVAVHLAPQNLKSKLREKLSMKIKYFHVSIRSISDTERQKEINDAQSVTVDTKPGPWQQEQKPKTTWKQPKSSGT